MVAVAAADSLLDQKEADEANEHCEAAEAVRIAETTALLDALTRGAFSRLAQRRPRAR